MSSLNDQLGMEFTPEEIAACREREGLLSIELELSRSCNLRCLYCYAASGEPLPDELTLAEITGAVDQARALGIRKVIVLGGGEPLLYPNLLPVLDHIVDAGLELDLFTNGLCLTDRLAAALFERRVGVVLKMNSFDPEVQDYLAGRAGAYQAIQTALETLRRAGYPDSGHRLGIETIICRQNYSELPQLWRWARQSGILPYVEVLTMQGRALEHRHLEVDSQAVRELFERLAQIDRQEFGYVWEPRPPLAASRCSRHEYSCTIAADGEVYPCPGVSVSGGNIRTRPLAEIVRQAQVFRDLRNIRQTIKGRCARCRLHQECYGCRGHAYQLTGDYLAEDPLCWLRDDCSQKPG